MALILINQENIISSFRFSIGSKLQRIQVFWLGEIWHLSSNLMAFDALFQYSNHLMVVLCWTICWLLAFHMHGIP